MKKERFEELLASVREGMAIERGEMEPSRLFVVSGSPPELRQLGSVVARPSRVETKGRRPKR